MVLSSEPAKIAGRSPDGRVGWPLRLSPAGESKCAETGVSGRAGGSKCAETERPPSAVANLQKRGPSLKSYFPPLSTNHLNFNCARAVACIQCSRALPLVVRRAPRHARALEGRSHHRPDGPRIAKASRFMIEPVTSHVLRFPAVPA